MATGLSESSHPYSPSLLNLSLDTFVPSPSPCWHRAGDLGSRHRVAYCCNWTRGALSQLTGQSVVHAESHLNHFYCSTNREHGCTRRRVRTVVPGVGESCRHLGGFVFVFGIFSYPRLCILACGRNGCRSICCGPAVHTPNPEPTRKRPSSPFGTKSPS